MSYNLGSNCVHNFKSASCLMLIQFWNYLYDKYSLNICPLLGPVTILLTWLATPTCYICSDSTRVSISKFQFDQESQPTWLLEATEKDDDCSSPRCSCWKIDSETSETHKIETRRALMDIRSEFLCPCLDRFVTLYDSPCMSTCTSYCPWKVLENQRHISVWTMLCNDLQVPVRTEHISNNVATCLIGFVLLFSVKNNVFTTSHSF